MPRRPTKGLLVKSSCRLQNDNAVPIPEHLNAIKGSFFIPKASCPFPIRTIKIKVVMSASLFSALTPCSLATLCSCIQRAYVSTRLQRRKKIENLLAALNLDFDLISRSGSAQHV